MPDDLWKQAEVLREIATALRQWGEKAETLRRPVEKVSEEERELARTALVLAVTHLSVIMSARDKFGCARGVEVAGVFDELRTAAGEHARGQDLGGYWVWVRDLTQPCLPGSVSFPAELERWASELEKKAAVSVGQEAAERDASKGGKWQTVPEIEEKIKVIAPTDASVLILGETGVGKEYFAKRIHKLSKRESKPFVPVNCATLPKERIDAELYGHKKGAFTGAFADRAGTIREAQGGTVFLDEVGRLPQECWGNLLRFLQDKEIRPVGSDRGERVDARILAATNAPDAIPEEVRQRFDEVLSVPPLREHRDDIRDLAPQFFRSAKDRPASLRFPKKEIEELAQADYDWPGNIRQSEKAVARAVRHHKGSRDLTAQEVLDAARQEGGDGTMPPLPGNPPPVSGRISPIPGRKPSRSGTTATNPGFSAPSREAADAQVS